MCRYMYQQYSCHWACFNCRKAFKAWSAWTMPAITEHSKVVRVCPECAGPLYDLGQDFKPPRKLAVSQWKKIELLFDDGVTFHSCGCTGPGPRPKTYSEAKRGRK